MKISLLAIRCKDIEVSRDFYRSLGLAFVKENHGNGPTHYSCEHDGCVFELYPNKGESPRDNSRLGFRVPDLTSIISKVAISDSYELAGNTIHIVTDPDGRKVELSE